MSTSGVGANGRNTVPKKKEPKASPFPGKGKGSTIAPRDPRNVTVVIFGAGIAGLTAAHELAERRFDVRVIEPATALGPDKDEEDIAIGGLARTQYVLKPTPSAAGGDFPVAEVTRKYAPLLQIRREKKQQPGLTSAEKWHLTRYVDKYRVGKERVAVDIHKTDALGIGKEIYEFLDLGGFPPAVPTPVPSPSVQTETSFPVVTVSLPGGRGDKLPGEHGFRFFPSYYRHVFDTLSRIPIYNVDENGIDKDAVTGRFVMENLVSTRAQAFADGGTNPVVYPREPPRSISGVAEILWETLVRRGYDVRDVHQFMLRVIRFMTTGSARRKAELEDMSWWDYLQGIDPKTGCAKYKYRKEFAYDVDFSPRVLAAADAEWGDARTSGSTFLQLVLNQTQGAEFVDATLNGPTSEAWLRHWKAYLEGLGVQFISAGLDGMYVEGDHIRPHIRHVFPEHELDVTKLLELIDVKSTSPSDRIYFVMATDVVAAERLTSCLPPSHKVGVAAELDGYTTLVAASPKGDVPARPRETFTYGEEEWDRFQTLTGIQYFFKNEFRLYSGHVYFMDAPWGLSSISQGQFWQERPTEEDTFRGVLSVDIGEWNRGAERHDNKSAWECTKPEVAEETWHQIVDAFAPYWKRHRRGPGSPALVMPDWYHLDFNMDLVNKINKTPFLIPIAGDWKHRPGGDPWDPGFPASDQPAPECPRLWQAPHGGYRVHWDQWVFAGTYMKHFTRMTTMEAANESGRHAVNAILDHLWSKDGYDDETATAGETDDDAAGMFAMARDPLNPDTAYVPTPYGDYAHIWDLEKFELDDTARFRELDDWLWENDLPHVWDLLGIEIPHSFISYLPGADDLGIPKLKALRRAFRRFKRRTGRGRRRRRRDWSGLPPETRRLMEWLESLAPDDRGR